MSLFEPFSKTAPATPPGPRTTFAPPRAASVSASPTLEGGSVTSAGMGSTRIRIAQVSYHSCSISYDLKPSNNLEKFAYFLD